MSYLDVEVQTSASGTKIDKRRNKALPCSYVYLSTNLLDSLYLSFSNTLEGDTYALGGPIN